MSHGNGTAGAAVTPPIPSTTDGEPTLTVMTHGDTPSEVGGAAHEALKVVPQAPNDVLQ